MLRATTKTKHYDHQDKPNSSFDTVLDSFLETGHFTLTNEIVTIELLSYFIQYLNLNKPARPSSKLDYKFYLDNVAFDLGVQNFSSDIKPVRIFMDKIFSFSPKWSVIALDNVSILQDENYYPLSAYFILEFLARFGVLEDNPAKLTITNALIITNAEFHRWAWMRFLTKPPRFDSLTLELLPNEEQEEDFLHLCDALQYAEIYVLNLGNTEITARGFRALNQLLDKNYWIKKVLLREPTDRESRAIVKKYARKLLYLDQEQYFEGRWPLAKYDLNQLVEEGTRTVGHWLLENALARNDTFTVECLIEAGANLLEQPGGEKPFLIQIFEKSRDFKLIILNHIIYHETFGNKIKQNLQDYPDSRELMKNMESSLIDYAGILRQRAWGHLDGYEMLLNLLKTVALLSRPSKQRDQEFIDIYWRLFKCLILFHDAEGKVTVESISNAQSMLNEIIAISKKADLGWDHGSKLHHGLPDHIDLLMKAMNTIKELVAQQANPLDEKGRVTAQRAANTDSEESQLNEPGPSTRFYPRR
ncbi:hypothetical protein [Rickettsiella endosymbiont of Miltochrista miniata]|uniref:hypothetical protein n=1 Tax=Rickettsiella endosymbiont of Miltochrista miniata TaxID=3066239 RepID=UPI00313ACFFB